MLPSLWEAVSGTRLVEWGSLDEATGKHVFTDEMSRCWAWKDELPTKRLALVGKHFGRWAALVAPRLIPHVYAAADARREELTGLQQEVVAAVRENGALTQPQLRDVVGAKVDTAVIQLQRALVLTNSHLVPQEQGWDAIAVDLVERLWKPEPIDDPDPDLARAVLDASGEVSAADLGGALGWRVKRSREALERLDTRVRRDGDVTVYRLA